MLGTNNPREAYGVAVLEAAGDNGDIMVLTCDVMHSSQTIEFQKKHPKRFFNMGVAEQNMAGVAAGMATFEKTPFINTFSCFASMRSLEMIRTDIAYPRLNVKVVCFNSGLSLGTGGTTHHSTEDIAIIRSIANMTLIVPGDAIQAYEATKACIGWPGPVYIRLGRGDMPNIPSNGGNFEIGKIDELNAGDDITIIACGYMVVPALKAADKLATKGISARVLNCHTIKPLDEEVVLRAAEETKGVITVEEHSVVGGLGGAIAELLSKKNPTQIDMIGIEDIFCTIGPTSDLFKHYNLNEQEIVKRSEKLLQNLI